MTSRIREREAEFQKQVQDREDQITHLKDRLKILSQKLSESKEKDYKFPRDVREREKVLITQKEDGVELQNILKQVCGTLSFHILSHKLPFKNEERLNNKMGLCSKSPTIKSL